MDPADRERKERIGRLARGASELDEKERAAYLEQHCSDAGELRAAVEELTTGGAISPDPQEPSVRLQPRRKPRRSLGGELSDPAVDPVTLGPYRVVARIGSGGMGVVYEAVDSRLDRHVAIKVLPLEYNRVRQAEERFLREARAASALEHPNICTVHDIGEADDGRLFLVMALYRGRSLDKRIAEGRLSVDDACGVAVQIARGLEAAHGIGILHRDIKPANIMLTDRGEAILLDFGVAKFAGSAGEESGITGSGMAVGTPAYMSPEQASGDEVDNTADVWSLGVVLYEMLTGRRPFEAKGIAALMRLILQAEYQPVQTVRPDVPSAVAALIDRMLCRERSARADASAVLAELDPTRGEHGPGPGVMVGVRSDHALAVVPGVVLKTVVSSDLLVDDADGSATTSDGLRVAGYDRELRALLAETSGQEVDSDDGLLVLFDRPLDAVEFALGYQSLVARGAASAASPITARVGVHLGEVALSINPPEQRAAGARPLAVAGQARTMAVLLKSVARGGQTLLTPAAFDLARRAMVGRELPSGQLTWLAHGRYQFDDLEQPIEVFEVGETGIAPLAVPADGPGHRRIIGEGEELVLGWRPAPGQTIPDRPGWVLDRKLSESPDGEVWLATEAGTEQCRVYKFCYRADRLQALQREVAVFRLLKLVLGRRDDITRILDWHFDAAPFYIEMEYAEGGALTEWAARQGGLRAVPLAVRLELLAQVAEALAAAHSVGLLHKDVQPANVLIGLDGGTPQARLTDFGIGLVTDDSVLRDRGISLADLGGEDRLTLGPPLYVAPELLEGKVPTIQADLYALGVMVYQVAVGDFTRALAPGWGRDVADDLLREDIAYFVDGEPRRRPADALEIARRLRGLDQRRAEREADESRQREAEATRVAAARGRRRLRILSLSLAVLLVFTCAMVLQERRTQRAAKRANDEALAARQVAGFLEGMFRVVDPSEARGNAITAREILDRSARSLETDLADQPEIRARMMAVIAGVYGGLGLHDHALFLAERALTIRRQLHGDGHLDVAASRGQVGRLLWQKGEAFAAAEAMLTEALSLRRQLGAPTDDVAETLCHLGDALLDLSRLPEAEARFRECLDLRRQRFGESHLQVAEGLHNLATLEFLRAGANPGTEAERLYRAVIAMYEELHAESHPEFATVLNNLAFLLKGRGDLAAAEPLFRRALALHLRVLASDHDFVGIGQSNLAIVLTARGSHVEAEALARRAVEVFRVRFGETHWQTAIGRSVLGATVAGQGRFEEAEPLLLESHRLLAARDITDYDYAAEALQRIVELYAAWGRPDRAASYRALVVPTPEGPAQKIPPGP